MFSLFFPLRPGFELTLKKSWFPPQRAPSARARSPRARPLPAAARRCPPLPAAAAARVDMNSASDWNLTMALDLDHGLTGTDQSQPNDVILFSYISSKMTPKFSLFSRWRKVRGDLRQFFHRFIHRFTPATLDFTNKTMTAKISAKKVGIFICKSRRMDVLKTAKA